MCMGYSKENTKALWERLQKEGKITVYKVFYNRGNRRWDRRNRLMSGTYPYDWKPGWNKSDRRPKKTGWMLSKTPKPDNMGSVRVNHGFHVYVTEKQAKWNRVGGEMIVEYTAYKKDFVAAGQQDWYTSADQAVFARLWLSRKEYDKAIGKDK